MEHRKIVAYLLNLQHPDGQSKARFFRSHGYLDAAELARSLLNHPQSSVLTRVDSNIYAPRFVYEGALPCPDGLNPHLRSIWELRRDETHARLITAYPCRPPGGADGA